MLSRCSFLTQALWMSEELEGGCKAAVSYPEGGWKPAESTRTFWSAGDSPSHRPKGLPATVCPEPWSWECFLNIQLFSLLDKLYI